MDMANQHKSLELGSDQLTDDLEAMHDYYTKWCLKPNLLKSEVCVVHLSNRQAQAEANVYLDGTIIRHNPYHTYLGVMLDRSLTYKQPLTKTAQKIESRNNILCKLAGTTWGADASTLRSTALAMTYSVAEYCAPVWYRSSHTHKIDVHLMSQCG
ncbi:hypothetical protein JTB14_024034 [Gonioctena quinquepunctata]|nr:hypothetical protein JTB14_024034 [Gonioctena quinquepunctata]